MTGCAVVLTQGIMATLQVAAAESPEQSHICYLLPTCHSHMVLPFVQSMHQTGVNQMREMHTRLLLQAMPERKREVVTSKVQRGSSPDLIAGKPA